MAKTKTARKLVAKPEDRLAGARSQGQAQFNSIKEMVDELQRAEAGEVVTNDRGEELDEESCRERIQEDALSIEVRSGWYVPGDPNADTKPAEYTILLCTGGPACRIVGELSERGEPETAEIEVQDWFTPWTAIRLEVAPGNFDAEPILLAYARCFYFGD